MEFKTLLADAIQLKQTQNAYYKEDESVKNIEQIAVKLFDVSRRAKLIEVIFVVTG